MFKSLSKLGFVVNLLLALGLMLLLIYLFFYSLKFITHHNEDVQVPLVAGKNVDEATQLLEAQGFEVEVLDSIYVDTAARASVIRQSPDAAAVVKKNRTIYLTINRTVAPTVEMPDLRGFSFQSAEMYLKSLSLKLGDTSYRPDIARNSVLEQLYKGKTVAPGTKVSMGGSISLVLGDGVGNVLMNVPNVVGMTLSDARSYLQSLSIGVGAIVPDPGISNPEAAFVYKQNPTETSETASGKRNNKIHPGQVIDLFLSETQPVIDSTGMMPDESN